MVAPGSPEALRALEYRHAVEFGWGGTPTEVLHKYLSALKNLRDPKQLVYFYPMNLNHRAKEGANILAQQEELRIKVAALLAQVFSHVNLVVLGQKINGNTATLRIRTTMTDPRSGSQRTAEEDFKMVREDGLWKIDISKYR